MKTQPYVSTMTCPPMPGFRVWFDNCGSEPHFYPEVDEDMMASFNEVRPWTAGDDEELRQWLECQKPVCAEYGMKSGVIRTETCIALFALFWSAVIALWAIGGLDDGRVRVLEDATPAGVHGTLKGE